jgi:hypothetical protein
MSLDYRPMLLSHQLFRETVPLNASNLIKNSNILDMLRQCGQYQSIRP